MIRRIAIAGTAVVAFSVAGCGSDDTPAANDYKKTQYSCEADNVTGQSYSATMTGNGSNSYTVKAPRLEDWSDQDFKGEQGNLSLSRISGNSMALITIRRSRALQGQSLIESMATTIGSYTSTPPPYSAASVCGYDAIRSDVTSATDDGVGLWDKYAYLLVKLPNSPGDEDGQFDTIDAQIHVKGKIPSIYSEIDQIIANIEIASRSDQTEQTRDNH